MADMETREVAFFGRITAGFTHELKNVLAIIKETAGLMEDLVSLSKEGSFPHRERLSRAITGVQDQVRRGVELSTRLNRFAHSPDEPIAAIDLNDTLGQLALLSERFARLKGVTLKVEPADRAVGLLTSPIGFQMALFMGMELCWNHMPAGGGAVQLCAGKKDREVVVRILCEGAELGSQNDFAEKIENAEGWLPFRESVAVVGGRFEWEHSAIGFSLIFPGDKEYTVDG